MTTDGAGATDGWREIVDAMEREEPVFVTGVPRSGTTVLRASLDRHDSFRAKRPWSPETKLFVKPRLVHEIVGTEGKRLLRFMLGDEAEARALLERLERMRREGGAAADTPRNLVRLYMHAAKRARGVRRLLEKTPRHLDWLERIREAFPRAKALVCIRHPVDVYSSYRKRLLKEAARDDVPENADVWRVTPDEFCERYERWVAALARGRAQWQAALRAVRYESLTADPAAELRAICAFLGEPFDAAALLDGLDVERDAHGSPLPTHRIAVNEKRWGDFLSRDEAQQIEARLAAAMETLGYARYC